MLKKARKLKSRISGRFKGRLGVLSRRTAPKPPPSTTAANAGSANLTLDDAAPTQPSGPIDNFPRQDPGLGLQTTTVEPAPATPLMTNVAPIVAVTPAPAMLHPAPPIQEPEAIQPDSGINEGAWVGLGALAKALKTVGESFGPLKSAVEMKAKNQDQYETLKADLEARVNDLAGYFNSPVPPAMTSSIENLARGIIREINFVKSKTDQSTLTRLGQAEQDTCDILKCYQRVNALLERLAQNANMNIWKIDNEPKTEQCLKDLGNSSNAWYSSRESEGQRNKCTENTRVQVLSDMKQWAYCGPQRVYWLNGMAGTGKTTIAYSLSDELHQDSKLAASFFCSRQLQSCSNVNLIFPTISYQLARFSHPFRYALSGALDLHPGVHTRTLPEQFQGLIAGPLGVVAKAIPKDLVVVIDGLDECDRQDGVEIILHILLAAAKI